MNTIITKVEKAIWADAYRFWERYVTEKPGPDFWDRLVADADELCEKHNGDQLFASLIKACVDDVERGRA